mgnify:CR=1 FL=1
MYIAHNTVSPLTHSMYSTANTRIITVLHWGAFVSRKLIMLLREKTIMSICYWGRQLGCWLIDLVGVLFYIKT